MTPEEALEEIALITDVMIGNGPGAVAAYNLEFNRVADGLPTKYSHLVAHACVIRNIVNRARGDLKNV